MKNNQKLSWNDLLFKNRNKIYGAYEIRTHENWNLLKSTAICLLVLGFLSIGLSFTKKKEVINNKKTEEPLKVIHLTKISEIQKIEKPQIVSLKSHPKKKVDKNKTEVIPTPTEKPKTEKVLVQNQDLGSTTTQDVQNGNSNILTNHQVGNIEGENGNEDLEPKKVVENNKIYNVRDISQMAVFPGCESKKEKEDLQNCMSQKLQKELGNELQDFIDIANDRDIKNAIAKLTFTVDKEGKIVHIKTMKGNNQFFDKEVQKALDKISKNLVQKGKYLKAAELDDGTKVNMSFSIPIKFQQN